MIVTSTFENIEGKHTLMLFDSTLCKKTIYVCEVWVDLEVLSGDVLTLEATWYLSKKVVYTLN